MTNAKHVSKTLLNKGLRRFILDSSFNIVPIRLNRYMTEYKSILGTRRVISFERADGTVVKRVYDNLQQAEAAKKHMKQTTIVVKF